MSPVRLIGDAALRTLAFAEGGLDDLRYRVLGGGRPQTVQILPYAGYRNERTLYLSGRVIAGRRPVERGDGTLSRMRTMLDLYESDEVPGVRLCISVYGRDHEVETDDEGYYALALDDLSRPLPESTRWEEGHVRALGVKTQEARYRAPILAPGTRDRLGIISDIDDTIVETGATNFLKNWRRVLAERPEDRLAVPGAPELYKMLAITDEAPKHPVFYVSSSPWNLYGFLWRFKALKDIPHGPMFLKDYGIGANKFIAGGHEDHKIEAVRRIMDVYPDHRFLLIGDNGQKDVEVYAAVVRDHAASVAGVFIRDVGGHCRDGARGERLAEIEAAGIEVYCGRGMEEAADVAGRIGFERAQTG